MKCVYVYIYIYIYTHTHTHTYIYIHVSTKKYVCMHIDINTQRPRVKQRITLSTTNWVKDRRVDTLWENKGGREISHKLVTSIENDCRMSFQVFW